MTNRRERDVPGSTRACPRGSVVRVLLGFALLLAFAAGARAELDVRASKRFDLQSYSVRGDLSQFLHDNPTFLDGNRLDQSLELEAKGTIGDRVTVDLFMDDSGFNDEDRRLRVDVAGRVWNLSAGRIPVTLPGSRFLMGTKTGMGLSLTGKLGRGLLELITSRPEGKTHRNSFTGKGALQEYVLTDSAGAPNPLVVVGSERVTLDGRRLVRGTDYEFDYVEGALLLARDLLPLDERHRIAVEFEEAGTGSGFESTVVGGRYTHGFGPTPEIRERNQLSLGYVAEVDDLSAPATADTSGIDPGRLSVVELAGRADVAKGVALRGRGAWSSRDTDLTSDEGHTGGAGAFDVGMEVLRGRLRLDLSRSVVQPGFEAVGIDRFQVAGEGREAARDAAVNTAEAVWTAGRALTLRARFRDAMTNLDHDPDQAEESVQETRVELDMPEVARGTVAIQYFGEGSSTRAASAEDFVAGGRDRVTAIRTRNLGASSLQVRGELEASRVDPASDGTPTANGVAGGQNHAQAGFELAGPAGRRIGWNVGAGVREVSVGRDWDVTRVVRDADAGVIADLGRDLQVGLDLTHRKDMPRGDLLDTTPVEEANTGDARVRWTRGDKVDVETQFTAEVRSRVLLDPNSPRLDRLRNPDLPARGLNTPKTEVRDTPVLKQGANHSVTVRPARNVEVNGALRTDWEKDTVTGEAFTRDRSQDARVLWDPSPTLRVSYEAGAGEGYNRPSDTERESGFRRAEVVKKLGERTSLGVTREAERTREWGATERDERVLKDRLGVEQRVRRNLLARGGVSGVDRRAGGHAEELGVDMSVEWSRASRGQRVEVGMELADVTGEDAQGDSIDGSRKKWFLNAGSRVGDDGFLDLSVVMSAVGPDTRGGEGYRGTTTNLSLGVEF